MRKILTIIMIALLTSTLAGCSKPASVPESSDTPNSSTNITESRSTSVAEYYLIMTDNCIDYQPWLECSAFASAYILRHYGYEAEFKNDGTVEISKELVSQGTPVIVFIHVAEPYETTHNTHYLPLIGYDAENLYFAESLTDFANCKDEKEVPYNRKTEISKFKRLWENIGSTWDYPYFTIVKK